MSLCFSDMQRKQKRSVWLNGNKHSGNIEVKTLIPHPVFWQVKINLNYLLYLKIHVTIFRTHVFTLSFAQITFQEWFLRIIVNLAGKKEKIPANYLLIFLILYYGNKCNFSRDKEKKRNSLLDICVSIILEARKALSPSNASLGQQKWCLHGYQP